MSESTPMVSTKPSLLTASMVLGMLTVAAIGLHLARDIAAPVFFAITLIVSARPLQTWLVRRRVHPMLAAVVVLVGLYVLLVTLVIAMAASLAQLVTELPRYAGDLEAVYNRSIDWLATFGVDEAMLESIIGGVDLNRVAAILGTVLQGMSAAGGQAVLILVVMFFLAIDTPQVDERWRLAGERRPEFTRALEGFALGARKYWVVATIFGLIVAVLDVVALALIGVPLVLVWGVLAFVTNYIPNVGFVLGLVPPALLALLSGGVSDMVWVILAYSVLNFTIQTIIQPKVTGDTVGLSPVVSFLSLAFWTLVVGPLGAILAVPLTLLAKAVLVDANPEARWINAFLVTDRDAAKLRARERAEAQERDRAAEAHALAAAGTRSRGGSPAATTRRLRSAWGGRGRPGRRRGEEQEPAD